MDIQFEAIERELIRQLQFMGLSAKVVDGRVDTGLKGLVIHRGKCEVAKAQAEASVMYVASVELIAHLNALSTEAVTIADLVTCPGSTPEAALSTSVRYYCDVTFPALHGLCDPTVVTPGSAIKLASVTRPENRMVNWRIFGGKTQILRDEGGKVQTFLDRTPALSLVLDTLTGYLSNPRLHWCKLFAAMTPKSGLVVGCSIDGQRSVEADAEMHRKLTLELKPEDQWELRYFFALIPDGQPQGDLATELRHEAQRSRHGRRNPGGRSTK